MRALGLVVVAALLQACQLGLPTTQPTAKNISAAAQSDISAETSLAAAFEQAAQVTQADAVPEKKGLLGFLKPKTPAVPAVLAGTDIEVVEGASTVVVPAQSDAPLPMDNMPALVTTRPAKSGQGGLFGFLKSKSGDRGVTQVALKGPAVEAPQSSDEAVSAESKDIADAARADQLLEAPLEPEIAPSAKPLPKKTMFGFLKPKGGALRALKTVPQKSRSTVAIGEILPFGAVGVACEVRPKNMGKQVDQFPSSGPATWRIFDTDPSSTTPRTQFITGFKDGCARQVTAALILFGSPSLHEVHRYAKARTKVSWSKADKGYEAIKSRVCSVGRETPCPSGKVGKLAKHMAFVSVYKQFGDAKGWLELLLHDGKIETQELR